MVKSHKRIKSPVKNGVAKVPVVMQLEALECGAASLTMILAYYEKWIPLEQVRADCGVSRDGSNAKNMLRAARSYGLKAQGYRYDTETLRKEGKFPCIVHWNFNHFVVLNGFKGKKAVLNDPSRGTYSVSIDSFDKSFTGICLMFEPAESFVPEGKPKSMLAFSKEKMRGAGVAVAFTTITTLAMSLIGIINPAFSRIFIDRLLTGQNPQWLMPFICTLTGLSIIHIVMEFISAIYKARIGAKIDAMGSTSFMWKILRLPMEFFSQRMAGDIQQRKGSNASVARTLADTFAPLIIEAGMMVFYLVVMLRYNLFLTMVGVLSIVINMILSRIISKKRVNITRVSMRDTGKLMGATVAGIEMIETIKASGAENGFFEKWSGYQASVNTQQVKYAKLNQYLGMIPPVVSTLTNTAILVIGVYLVMVGKFTVGMVMAFQGFLGSFMSPAQKFISAGQTLQEMRSSMERIEDVMKYPTDRLCEQSSDDAENDTYSKLSGNVEMKNVTFGYSRLAEPLIKDFSLTLTPGKRIAFVGMSGCGKSTIAKLLAGLYQPWSGEILYDGKPISSIDRNVFTGSLAVVDQEIILFEGTISDNIKMWDSTIEDFEMILAARDAQIHNDIMQREGGYSYKLIEGGKDFSGGQRQRLEIARVLAQDPTIVILDEATSALDAKTEYEVIRSIKDRGITCIVVAHRLSTIRDCDEIIVMNHGDVVERGTHDELYALDGFYTKLVTSD